MEKTQTIFIPFAHRGEVLECKPHKFVLGETYLESYHYSRVVEENPETSLKEETFRDVQSLYIRSELVSLDRYYCNRSEKYVVTYGTHHTGYDIFFESREDANEFYRIFKQWLIS